MAEMTSRERILAVLRREMPDRVPLSPRIGAWMKERYGNVTFLEYLDLKKQFGYDPIITVMPDVPYPVYTQFVDYGRIGDIEIELTSERKDRKLYVSRTVRTPAGSLHDRSVFPPPGREYGIIPDPEKLEPLVKDSADLERLRYLLPSPDSFGGFSFERIDSSIGSDGMLQVRPHKGVDHLLMFTLGYEPALMMYYDDRDLLFATLRLFHDYYIGLLRYCLERGARMIFESWYNCSLSAGWSPEIYEECFLPLIIEDARIVHEHGAYFHFYDDGKIMPILHLLRRVGADLISPLCPPPMGDVDAEEIKRELGPHVALNGFVELQTVRFGTPREVEEKVRYAIETLGHGGGYILGTNDSIRDGSPIENVAAFFEAGRKYGRYS